MSLKDKYAICGLGVSKQGKMPGVNLNALRAEVAQLAIDDAGLTPKDIDGYIYQGSMAEMRGGFFVGGNVPQRLGLEPKFIWRLETGGVTAISSILAATGAIEAGLVNYVLCLYATTDLSEGLVVAAPPGGRNTPGSFGMFSPGADHAFAARRHMYEYGTTQEQLGAIAVTQRQYSQMRPDAFMYNRPLTMEDYLKSKWVAEPFHILDMCLISDGGIAFIVTTPERSRSLRPKPVYIMGIGLGHQLRESYRKEQYTTLDVGPSKEAAFQMAGITIEDLDVAQMYDCFTITVLLETEGYGFCKKGEGGAFYAEGHSKLGGKIPINTSGGNLSWGYNQGFTPVAEAVRQLRGEGGATQVKDAEIALCSGHGTTSLGSMNYAHGTLVLRR